MRQPKILNSQLSILNCNSKSQGVGEGLEGAEARVGAASEDGLDGVGGYGAAGLGAAGGQLVLVEAVRAEQEGQRAIGAGQLVGLLAGGWGGGGEGVWNVHFLSFLFFFLFFLPSARYF